MIGFIILCVWTALFIGIGVLLIVYAKKINAWQEKFLPVYFKFVDKMNLKLLHIETTNFE